MRTIQEVPQPVVARVHALATAAGCQLVATADLAVAAEEAQFAAPGGQGGWFCHTPMVAIARTVGRKRALELAFTGDPIDARTALDWGLVNRVVPAGRPRRRDRTPGAGCQPRQSRVEGAGQAGAVRNARPGRRRRLRARHRGDGRQRLHRRRPRGHAVVPGEAAGHLPAASVIRLSGRPRRPFPHPVGLAIRETARRPGTLPRLHFPD